MNVMIILNYNDHLMTTSYLQKIKDYAILDKIIVVDNNSTDNSFEVLSQFSSDKIIVLSAPENQGYASGNNVGLNYAFKHYDVENFIISNPDIEVSENVIKSICECLDKKDFITATGLIKNKAGFVAKNFAWYLPKYYHILSETFILSTMILKKFNLSRFYQLDDKSDIKKVEVLSGCFFAINAKVFRDIGFFDERTFLYGEENCLFYKIEKLGYKNGVLLNQDVIHYGGESIKKNIKGFFKKQRILMNSEINYLKNYLKVNTMQLEIYKVLFHLGSIEKYIIFKLTRRM